MIKGQYERVPLALVMPAAWTTTKHTKRQAETLQESLRRFGQLHPVTVRELVPGLYEAIDGSKRCFRLSQIGQLEVDVLNLGQMDNATAREIHLTLNLNRGKPEADAFADALDLVVSSQPDDQAKARKEVALIDALPIAKKGIDQIVAKLRARTNPPSVSHNPKASQGWVDFQFKVASSAARVCDDALSHVEQVTGCKRGVAFELLCADYLSGASSGGQP